MPPRLATSCRLSAWTISWTTPTGFFGTSSSRCDTTKLVAGFCRGGNYGKVSELLHLMIGGDCMPGIFTYHATIRGLGDNGKADGGFRVFDDFKLRGYAPILVTYTTVIDGLCKMGRIVDVWNRWLETVAKVIPNESTYDAIIDGCCKADDLGKAQKLYSALCRRRSNKSTVSCNSMISGLCIREGDMRSN
ncbi:hypothetical protein BHM03_00040109 [Ensete ventricosum]|nr:hypothetical protein BHM03_00040109 [Ensete ventricosum]